MPQTTRATPIRVVFVAFEGMSLLDLSGPLEVFGTVPLLPGRAADAPRYETHVVSADGGPVMTCVGVPLMTTPFASLKGRAIDTLIVPGGPRSWEVIADARLLAWVKARAPKW